MTPEQKHARAIRYARYKTRERWRLDNRDNWPLMDSIFSWEDATSFEPAEATPVLSNEEITESERGGNAQRDTGSISWYDARREYEALIEADIPAETWDLICDRSTGVLSTEAVLLALQRIVRIRRQEDEEIKTAAEKGRAKIADARLIEKRAVDAEIRRKYNERRNSEERRKFRLSWEAQRRERAAEKRRERIARERAKKQQARKKRLASLN